MGSDYAEGEFDRRCSAARPRPLRRASGAEADLAALMEENAALARRTHRPPRGAARELWRPSPNHPSTKTRKLYIDAMLRDAGWIEGGNWLNEVELPWMPNKSELGYADYVLYDDTLRPLAVIEAKRHLCRPRRGPSAGQALRGYS